MPRRSASHSIPWRSIRAKTASRRVAEQIEQPLAVVSPRAAGSSSGITHMPAFTKPDIAARAAEADLRTFEHGDGGAALGQVQGGGEAGEAGADHGDLDFGVTLQRRGRGRLRRGALPETVAAWIALHAAAFPPRLGMLDHNSLHRR